ncbi:MAG: hypothetical protein ACYSU7_18745, partial [Planctomycetota bacterium]
MSLGQRIPALMPAAVMLALAGCSSPFQRENADQILRQRVAAAIDRELETLPPGDELLVITQPEAEVEDTLRDRRDELEALSPEVTAAQGRFDMGLDLTGGEQQEVTLSLRSAIDSAVRNNLTVQIARLQPAITEADVVAAEAVFDAVFYSAVDYANVDQPVAQPVIGGMPIGSAINASDQFRFETGV